MIEQLLADSIVEFADCLDSDAERGYFLSMCEGLTLDELLDRQTSVTCYVLHLAVRCPSRLIQTLN